MTGYYSIIRVNVSSRLFFDVVSLKIPINYDLEESMRPTGSIGRKTGSIELKEKPAIVVAAFGSTRRGKAALELFDKQVKKRFSDHEIFWAYTSEFIRKRSGLPGVHQALASIEAAGYRKAVVLPLHIFPGMEYQEVAETIEYFPGLRILLSETLMHRWEYIKKVLDVVAVDFLPASEGLNILALHGTPIAADPVNTAYLGVDKLVNDRYDNVLAASLEGVPDHEAVMSRIARHNLAEKYQRARIVPLLYLAGLHVEDDLMGDSGSWRASLTDMGFEVDCMTTSCYEQQYFKSLAFYEEINTFFLDRLERTLDLMKYY